MKSWVDLPPDDLETLLFSLGIFIEKAGTGGGLFRRLLADGCTEIARLTGDPATADLAGGRRSLRPGLDRNCPRRNTTRSRCANTRSCGGRVGCQTACTRADPGGVPGVCFTLAGRHHDMMPIGVRRRAVHGASHWCCSRSCRIAPGVRKHRTTEELPDGTVGRLSVDAASMPCRCSATDPDPCPTPTTIQPADGSPRCFAVTIFGSTAASCALSGRAVR